MRRAMRLLLVAHKWLLPCLGVDAGVESLQVSGFMVQG